MRRVQTELEVNKKLLSEKTAEKERNQSHLNREIEQANASYENYEYQIQSLKSANQELLEKIEPIEKEHTCERKLRDELDESGLVLKTQKNKLESEKTSVRKKLNSLCEKLEGVRTKLDEVLDDQHFLKEQNEAADRARDSMTSILHDIIKKERNQLKIAKQNRLSVYKARFFNTQ